jgi:hypothetical protein
MHEAIAGGARLIHLILDNGSIHRPKYLSSWLAAWLKEHGYLDVQVLLHWLPVRSSWLNQVEIYFSLVQAYVLSSNNADNTDEIAARILEFTEVLNCNPRPVEWSYTFERLCAKHDWNPLAIIPAEPVLVQAAKT